ncbi:hypothetical protein D3C79_574720 [compost metagenome]
MNDVGNAGAQVGDETGSWLGLGQQRGRIRQSPRHRLLSQCRAAGQALQRAPVQAVPMGALFGDDHVGNLAGTVVRTADQLPLVDETTADTGTHRDVEDAGMASARPEQGFPQCGAIGVVLQPHRQAELGLQHRPKRDRIPVRQGGLRMDHPIDRIQRPRGYDPYSGDPIRLCQVPAGALHVRHYAPVTTGTVGQHLELLQDDALPRDGGHPQLSSPQIDANENV